MIVNDNANNVHKRFFSSKNLKVRIIIYNNTHVIKNVPNNYSYIITCCMYINNITVCVCAYKLYYIHENDKKRLKKEFSICF